MHRIFFYSDIIQNCKKVLVLSPHQDDEIIGCGGLLYKLRNEEDADIRIVYLSDGSKGTPESEPSIELANIRKSEANEVLRKMNIENYSFKELPDGRLINELITLKQVIADEIKNFTPDAVLFPYNGDQHSDHLAVSSIVLNLIDQNIKIMFIGYEVWGKIENANLFILLSQADFEIKLCLSKIYESQQKSFDYYSLLSKCMSSRGEEIGYKFAEAYYIY